MARKYTAIILCISIVLSCSLTARAGGNLQSLDLTGLEPAPFGGGFIKGRFADVKWDPRCIPVQFTIDNNDDPIPNPDGPPFLSLATVKTVLQRAMDSWNQIPTSFIDLQITGEQHASGLPGFDMVNQITFQRFPLVPTAVGASLPVTLVLDSNIPDGVDIDGDGDSDFSAAITVATDLDHDGDIEFPAGFYKAGTALDADVYLNAVDYRFRISDSELGDPASYDLEAIAVHEVGHSTGLSHSMENQISQANATAASMFPFPNHFDPDNELAQRSLTVDDQTRSSFYYQEGSAATGPASLQAGDVSFNQAFGLIKGELRHGWMNEPILGGAVYAINRKTGERLVSTFSGGATQFYFNGNSFFLPDSSFLDGHYELPVPNGDYVVGVEPVDSEPAEPHRFNFLTLFGDAFGQNDFNEQFFTVNNGAALPSEAKSIHVKAGQTVDNIDITTGRNLNISNFSALGSYVVADSVIFAQRIPATQIAAANSGHDILIQAAAFQTHVADASVAPLFAEAGLASGTVNPDGTATINVNNPLERSFGFVGQENDFAPFYFHNPKELGKKVRAGIANGQVNDLFMLLKVGEGPFPGHFGLPPVIAVDNNPNPQLLSYISFDNGQTFFPIIYNYRASLWMSQGE